MTFEEQAEWVRKTHKFDVESQNYGEDGIFITIHEKNKIFTIACNGRSYTGGDILSLIRNEVGVQTEIIIELELAKEAVHSRINLLHRNIGELKND